MLYYMEQVLRHFKTEFPELKWSTINDWKDAIVKQKRFATSRDKEPVDVVELTNRTNRTPVKQKLL